MPNRSVSVRHRIDDPRRRRFIALNAIGGLLVIASYAWGALGEGPVMHSLWGGVPERLQPVYTINMLLSVAGYFLFAPYIAFRVDTGERHVVGTLGYSLFGRLMVLVLLPSACWLPLTSMMLSDPSPWLWWIIRLDLALVGVGSVGLFVSLCALSSPIPPGRAPALIGLVPFCIQTAILDALVWPAYFTV